MSREQAIARAEKQFDDGTFFELLAGWVHHPTESQNEACKEALKTYLTGAITPYLENMGFTCRLATNPLNVRLPFLIGQRMEAEDLPTVLIYGHGDTVLAMDGRWRQGLEPWRMIRDGDRWYGRGAADNKGQHAINLAALACVLEEKKQLGFNVKVLIEMGEEMGSPGLHKICAMEKQALAADVLIASDGPRIDPQKPTLFGGSRAVFNFDMRLDLREGGHHSGNWGGLLANPGIILAHAIASMVDARGKILVEGLRPQGIPQSVKRALSELEVTGREGPAIDPDWGEPGFSRAEKVYGWNTLEVLAFECGNPAAPVHAIPPSAWARMHVRFVAGCNPDDFIPAVRSHLDDCGFAMVDIIPPRETWYSATRMDPDNPWAQWAISSVEKTCGQKPAFLPNLGGTLPNDAFSQVLDLPTIWVAHSYGGCSQHAPNEHLLAPIVREGLRIMAGLFWDLAQNAPESLPK
ncbi:MAG: M20 family metallopeptidase [Desulfobacterales bacterium]|nr:MAG: M20 family metallopeptidase [Desulfobacterales bacterium]